MLPVLPLRTQTGTRHDNRTHLLRHHLCWPLGTGSVSLMTIHLNGSIYRIVRLDDQIVVIERRTPRCWHLADEADTRRVLDGFRTVALRCI